MARINYPKEFLKQVELAKKIRDKHTADGALSVLTDFFKQNNIDLKKEEDDSQEAVKQHTEFMRLDNIATDYTQDRDNIIATPWDNYTNGVQYLKTYYPDNVRELTKWGVPVDNDAQINYPADFMERTALVQKFYAYHDSLGAKSPLNTFLSNNNIDVKKQLEDTASAIELHNKMLQTRKDAEQYSGKRDILFNPIWKNVHRTGNFLKTTFPKEPKKLGEWGFTIDDSKRAPVKRTAEIKPNSTKTLTGVKNGTQVTNTGSTELFLYKGAGVKEEGVKLAPGESFDVVRGWGTITVQNKNTAQSGKITYFSIFNPL